MQVLKLFPKQRCKGKFLNISNIAVWWEGNRLNSIIVFHVTRNREDTKAAGMKIFTKNIETTKKMLQEVAELYPVQKEMNVYIPEIEQEGEKWSYYT